MQAFLFQRLRSCVDASIPIPEAEVMCGCKHSFQRLRSCVDARIPIPETEVMCGCKHSYSRD